MNKAKPNPKATISPGSTRLAATYASQFALTLLSIVALTLVAFALVRYSSSRVIWHGNETFYKLGTFIKSELLALTIIYFLLALLITTGVFFYKMIHTMNAITQSAAQLATGDSQSISDPIALPKSVKHLEDQLNFVRERAYRAAQEAKQAEQRKNDLIVYLAHDLKTPLTSVIGYLTLLADEPEISPALRDKYTQIALKKSLRLEDLIDEFFEITRFNLSQIRLEPERIHLTRLLDQLAFEFLPELTEKGLSFDLDLQGETYWVGDSQKIQRVFDNIIRNAISYSYPNSQIRIKMEVEVEVGAGVGIGEANESWGETIAISFENRGKTIPEEKILHLFDQFFRLDQSRGSHSGGAGLGLAIAKAIVEKHGGTITAQSAEERVTFTVILPQKS